MPVDKNTVPLDLVCNPNDKKAIELGYYYDQTYPDKVIWFIENFVVHHTSDFAGKLFILEPWQKQLIKRLYGWRRPNGKRRFTKIWFEIGRGNGKTKLLSALAIYHLIADGVSGAEVYCAASDRAQAGLLFEETKKSIKSSQELDGICNCFRSEIKFDLTNSSFKTCSADGYRLHGTNPSCVFIDEVHTFKSNEVVEALETGLNKRGENSEPIIFFATTAGNPNTYYEEMHDYASSVDKGTIKDLHFLPIIYAVPNEVDWKDETYWHLANPNMGVSVSLNKMRENFEQAKQSVSIQISFRRLFLNQIVQAEHKWINLNDWDACKGVIPEYSVLKTLETYAGLDLSENMDMTALVLLHYDPKNEFIYVEPYFYLPHSVLLDTTKRLHNQYLNWYHQGLIKTIEGKTIKHRIVKEDILKLNEKYNIRDMGIDPFMAIQLAEELTDNGIKNQKFIQSHGWYTVPCKGLETEIAEKRLVTDGNPILRWMADNSVLDIDASGKCMLSKQKSNDKVDGIAALLFGLDRIIRNRYKKIEEPQPTGKVIWI